MYTKQILSSTTSIQTKYLTSGSKFILDLKKASQSGRSMVEMLGVLGIIGLLSVGGIAAYQYLFSVSEANRISNKILTDYNRLISTAGRRLVVPEDFSDYAFVLGEDKQTLTVTVDNLESEVAQELMTNMGTMVSGLDEEVKDGKSTVTLTFDIPSRRGGGRVNRPLIPDNAYWEEDDKGNLYQTSCPPLTLTACTQAVAGRDGCNVVKEMPDGTKCGAVEKGYSKMCFHGQCFKCQTAITDEQLKKGICSIEITAPCKAATLTAEGETCGNEHGTCTDGVCQCNPPWEGVDCATCGLVCQNGGTPNEDCSACDCPSNRTGDNCETCANPWTGDNCETCDLTCQNGGTANEECTACDCPSNWTGDNCDVCNISASNCGAEQYIDSEHCLCVCGTEGYTGYYCSYSCPSATRSVSGLSKSACEACGDEYIWLSGTCYGCGSSSNIFFPTEAEAEACENACAGTEYERIAMGRYCHLAKTDCPSETTSRSNMTKSVCETCDNTVWKNGTCYGCGYSASISFDTEAEAEACVSACAGSGYERTAEGRYCYGPFSTNCPSETTSTSNMTKSDCDKCNTVWSDGTCYGCGYLWSISFDTEAEAEACASTCAGSGYERDAYGKSCSKLTCPSATSYKSDMSKSGCEACDNTVWKDGTCYGCGYSLSISFPTEAEAEACVSACAGSGYERTAEGRYCYLATNTGCPLATSYKDISKSVCEACGNTFWGNGRCYGCGYSSTIFSSTKAEAETCENACAGTEYKRIAMGTNCFLAETDCPWEMGSNIMTKSTCEACDNTVWSDGGCYDCGYFGRISFPTEAEAEACVSACAGSGYEWMAEGKYCYGSPTPYCTGEWETTANITKSVCEWCDNVFWNDGYCYGCGVPGDIYFATEAEAEACVTACADSGYPREVDKSGSVYYCNRK